MNYPVDLDHDVRDSGAYMDDDLEPDERLQGALIDACNDFEFRFPGISLYRLVARYLLDHPAARRAFREREEDEEDEIQTSTAEGGSSAHVPGTG